MPEDCWCYSVLSYGLLCNVLLHYCITDYVTKRLFYTGLAAFQHSEHFNLLLDLEWREKKNCTFHHTNGGNSVIQQHLAGVGRWSLLALALVGAGWLSLGSHCYSHCIVSILITNISLGFTKARSVSIFCSCAASGTGTISSWGELNYKNSLEFPPFGLEDGRRGVHHQLINGSNIS